MLQFYKFGFFTMLSVAILAFLGTIWPHESDTMSSQHDTYLVDDEQDIKSVIEKQTLLFNSREFEKYATVWGHESHIVRMYTNGERITGWDDIGQFYKSFMEENKEPVHNLTYEPSDFHIHIYDEMAWVIHNQHVGGTLAGETTTVNQWMVRILEKKDGQWKIVFTMNGDLSSEAG